MGRLGLPGFGLGLHATFPSAPLTAATLGHQTRSPFRTRLASRQGSSCRAPGVCRRIPKRRWQGAALRTATCSGRIPGESCSKPPVAHRSTLPRKPPAGIKTHLLPLRQTQTLWTRRFQEANTLFPLPQKIQISGRSVPHTNVPYQYLWL